MSNFIANSLTSLNGGVRLQVMWHIGFPPKFAAVSDRRVAGGGVGVVYLGMFLNIKQRLVYWLPLRFAGGVSLQQLRHFSKHVGMVGKRCCRCWVVCKCVCVLHKYKNKFAHWQAISVITCVATSQHNQLRTVIIGVMQRWETLLCLLAAWLVAVDGHKGNCKHADAVGDSYTCILILMGVL